MKKLLYIWGVIMFSTALLSPFLSHRVFGADSENLNNCDKAGSYSEAQECVPFSTASIFNKLNFVEKDWTSVFGMDNPEDLGKDLYMMIYEEVDVQPEVQAAKNITGRYGTTEAEMAKILSGNIAPILNRAPALPQEQAIRKVAEIQQQFQDEKDLLEIKATVEATVTPSEIFTNDTLTDSGFDLVRDLSNIEKILFLKADPIDVGGVWAGNDEGSGAGAGGAGGNGEGSKESQNGGSNNQDSKSQAPDGKNKQVGNKTPIANTDPASNPNICFGENDLQTAVNAYDQKSGIADSKSQKNGLGQNSVADGGIGSSANSGDSVDVLPQINGTDKPVKPAKADQWVQNDDCADKVFCLKVNFIKKPVVRFQNSDNCIACHVEKINEKLKDTLNHSLIPGKATGNLLEPEFCKKAASTSFSAITMNFYAVPKPVQTPINDDLIYGVNIGDEWDRYLSTYKQFPFYEKNPPKASDKKADTIPPSETDRAAKAALSTAAPDANFDQIQQAINKELSTNKQMRDNQIAIAEPALQSDNDVGFYQAIKGELQQMNFYFENFKNIIHSLHEPVDSLPGKQACTELKNKKQCE